MTTRRGMVCKYEEEERSVYHLSRRTILTVPSHELEMKVSLVMGFQATAKASRLCSWKIMMGNSFMPMSKSLRDPSPQATTSWFSLISDQARSYIASFVSNLPAQICKPSWSALIHFPTCTILNRAELLWYIYKHTFSQLGCLAPSAPGQRACRFRRCQSWRLFQRRYGSRGMAST